MGDGSQDDDMLFEDIVGEVQARRSSTGGAGGGEEEQEEEVTSPETTSPEAATADAALAPASAAKTTAAAAAAAAAQPGSGGGRGKKRRSPAASDEDEDEYDKRYSVKAVADLDDLRWTQYQGVWVPCRILSDREKACRSLGENFDLPDGEHWVEIFPPTNTYTVKADKKQEGELKPFNEGEEGGANVWSKKYQDLAPGAEKKKEGAAPKKRKRPALGLKKKEKTYTSATWKVAMGLAQQVLEATLAKLAEERAKQERERAAAANLEMISSDEEEDGVGAADGSERLAAEEERGQRKGRGHVKLRVGDMIQYKGGMHRSGEFVTAAILQIEGRQPKAGGILECPLRLDTNEALDWEVHVRKVAKYREAKNGWQEVPEDQWKFMPIKDHDLTVGKATDKLRERVGATSNEQMGTMMQAAAADIYQVVDSALRGEKVEELEKMEEEEEEGKAPAAKKGDSPALKKASPRRLSRGKAKKGGAGAKVESVLEEKKKGGKEPAQSLAATFLKKTLTDPPLPRGKAGKAVAVATKAEKSPPKRNPPNPRKSPTKEEEEDSAAGRPSVEMEFSDEEKEEEKEEEEEEEEAVVAKPSSSSWRSRCKRGRG